MSDMSESRLVIDAAGEWLDGQRLIHVGPLPDDEPDTKQDTDERP